MSKKSDIITQPKPIVPKKRKKDRRGAVDNITMFFMTFPTMLYIFIFSYVPMFGLILAFKDYKFSDGIFGSAWVGLNNFVFYFTSQDAFRTTYNTVFMNFLFIVIGISAAVICALLLFEITQRALIKTYQTIMILPSYLSWVVVAYMVYALLHPQYGLVNQIVTSMGGEIVDWYSAPNWWPFIMTFAVVWKNLGLDTVMYYAGLMGVSSDYYEAAAIDGANKLQQTWYISIPFLVPLITVLTTLRIGNIFRADFGMFFAVTKNSGPLYPTMDVIDTYVFRALRQLGDTGMSAAVGLYQSLVGFVLILVTNWIVNKIEPDNALF